MKYELICLICLFGISHVKTEDDGEASSLLIRSGYCACRCCEKNQDICSRHKSIPSTFKCSKSTCNDTYCEAWDKAKCQKECFCEVCKDKIADDDFRCVSHTGVRDACKCDPQMSCDLKHKTSDKGVKPECVVPCLCKECKGSLTPEIERQCLTSSEEVGECDCTDVECPTQDLLDGLKKLKAMREKKEKSGDAYSFSQEIDDMLEPDKAKDAKCRMQCFCNVCSVGSAKLTDGCRGMFPTSEVNDCNCNRNDIKCPSDDDQQCEASCFCKRCSKDSRMPEEMKQTCNGMKKKNSGCTCPDKKEDCSVLSTLSGMPKPPQKKKPKKGKLKPKKKDRDEL